MIKIEIISEGGFLTKKGLYYIFSNGLKIYKKDNKNYKKLLWDKLYTLKELKEVLKK